jgi:hypothetical protein
MTNILTIVKNAETTGEPTDNQAVNRKFWETSSIAAIGRTLGQTEYKLTNDEKGMIAARCIADELDSMLSESEGAPCGALEILELTKRVGALKSYAETRDVSDLRVAFGPHRIAAVQAVSDNGEFAPLAQAA